MSLIPVQGQLERPSPLPSLSLVTLESMPCGCVAGIYLTGPTIVELERLEAKGPHCVFWGHWSGRVLGVGAPEDLEDD